MDGFSVEAVRKDFPILDRLVHGDRRLVYLDSANTSQKPRAVLDALAEHYERHNANIHRAQHVLAEEATAAYEGARDKVRDFIGAPAREEVVFTKNASEALNLVANTLAWRSPYQIGPGDEIVVTEMEHHSNIVPWQLLAERTGATLRWFGITDEGRLDLSELDDADHRAHQGGLAGPGVQHAGHPQPGRRGGPAGPRGRRAGGGRRLPGGAAAAGRRHRAGRRLPRLHRPQDVRPDRDRRAVGPAVGCSPSCRRSSAAAR